MKKLYIVILTTFITANLTGCTSENSPSASTDTNTQNETVLKEESAEVTIEKVHYNSVDKSLSYIGTVKAGEEITIKARAEGIVSEIYVKAGDTIKENDLIIDLSDPNGENSIQINYQIAQESLKSARQNLSDVIQKTNESLKNAELALDSANQRLSDSKTTLDKTSKQTSLSIENSKIQLENTENSFNRLKDTIDLTSTQISVNESNINDTSEMTYKNAEDALELTLYLTIPSIFITLDNLGILDRGLERDLEDLQDDHDDIRRNDPDEILRLIDDTHDFIVDISEDLNDKADQYPDTIPSLLANLNSIDAQIQSLRISVTNAKNSTNIFPITSQLQLKTLLDQLNSIEDQIKILENAIELAETQSSLTEHSLLSNINQYKIDIDSKKININLTKIGNNMEIENAESRVKTAELQLKQASLQSQYLNVESTINGIVSDVLVEKGQLVSSHEPVIKAYNYLKKEIEIYMTTKDVLNIKIGDSIEILTNDNLIATGKISEIYPTADPNTHLIPVIISVEDSQKKLIPNSTVDIEIPIQLTADNIYIPLKSVLIREEGNYVFISKNNIAQKQAITLGEIFGTRVQIISGLEINDLVIVDGNRNIKEGDKITVIE